MLDNKVETFLTVCQVGNFTKASKLLHISQPAVTQQLQALEAYYQVPLFEFEGKKFSLTKYGTLIYQTLTSMRNNEIYLMERIEALQKGQQNIYMGVTKTVGEYFISAEIAEYLKKNPKTSSSIIVANTESLLEELNNGKIDFAIVEGNFPRFAYDYNTLSDLEFVPVCNSSHSFARPIETLEDLFEETLIVREEGSGTREILSKFLQDHNHSLNDFSNQLSIGNMHVIVDLIMEDCGITFLYKKAIEKQLESGEISEIYLKDFSLTHEINVIVRKDNLQKEHVFQLIRDIFPLKMT